MAEETDNTQADSPAGCLTPLSDDDAVLAKLGYKQARAPCFNQQPLVNASGFVNFRLILPRCENNALARRS